jgi:hypothetical protein
MEFGFCTVTLRTEKPLPKILRQRPRYGLCNVAGHCQRLIRGLQPTCISQTYLSVLFSVDMTLVPLSYCVSAPHDTALLHPCTDPRFRFTVATSQGHCTKLLWLNHQILRSGKCLMLKRRQGPPSISLTPRISNAKEASRMMI